MKELVQRMATLTAWKFPTAEGADQAVSILENLQKEQLITVQDAATVSWPAGKKSPKTKEQHSLAGAGALGGAFWGLLFGLLFFVPILGLAIGAGLGALAGSMSHYGIDDDFINNVRAEVIPGTSALFALTENAVVDRVADAFKDTNAKLIESNLSKEQEAELKKEFAS
jgi:uncharacterized membrane protein